MKNLISFIIAVLILAFMGILSPIYGQWNKHIIDNNLEDALDIRIADMDGDGDLDVVASGLYAYDVVWYEAPSWEKHFIDNNLKYVHDIYIADMNGDDTLDVVAAGEGVNTVLWYEAPSWKKNVIDTDLEWVAGVQVADMDGDNDLDVVAAGKKGDVVWYEAISSAGHVLSWTRHKIDDNLGGARHVFIADIDGDDTLDVVATGKDADDVVWYKAPSWKKNFIDDNLNEARGLYVSDLDNDGDLDVVAAGSARESSNPSDLVWYEAPSWTKRKIDDNLIGARQVYVGDIDKDNDLDIVVAAWENANDVLWYENSGDNLTWTKHIIDNNLLSTRCVYVADLDNDNDLDVIATGAGANQVVWYENLGKNTAYGKSIEIYPGYIKPQDDSLYVYAKLANPENHPASVFALIKGDQSAFKDSIQLFDDGLHIDSTASDSIWGGLKLLSGLEEDIYTVKLRTHDLTTGTKHFLYQGLPLTSDGPALPFTTIGPVVYDSFKYKPFIGLYWVTLYLKNMSSSFSLNNISAEITTSDTAAIELTSNLLKFGDIAPGEIKISSNSFTFRFNDSTRDSIPFQISILSNNIAFWHDEFSIDSITHIENNDHVFPYKFSLFQNYPNPFNPKTIINYELGIKSEVKLSIFNVMGQKVTTLVSQTQQAGFHQVECDARDLASGIYYYQLVAGDYREIRKMILIH